MAGGELFLIIFGSILAICGIALFVVFIWFKKTAVGHTSIKMAGAEISLSHPALLIFVVGCILLVIPFAPWSKLATPPVQGGKITQVSETADSDYFYWSTKAYFLGHNLVDLVSYGMVVARSTTPSDRKEFTDIYSGVRHAFLQTVKMFGIELDIDIAAEPDADWADEAKLTNFYRGIDDELQWKINTIEPAYIQPYRSGKWTGLVVFLLALRQHSEREELREAIGALIKQFDTELRGFQDFDIGNDIKLEFEGLYLDLVVLSGIGSIDNEAYLRISNRVDRITDLIDAAAR
jgi:hypothetical protein